MRIVAMKAALYQNIRMIFAGLFHQSRENKNKKKKSRERGVNGRLQAGKTVALRRRWEVCVLFVFRDG